MNGDDLERWEVRNHVRVTSCIRVYSSILEAYNVADPTCNRKALKQLLQIEIPDIEFHRAAQVNESERVSIKRTRDAAIQLAENQCRQRY